jgi:hypothetical protein
MTALEVCRLVLAGALKSGGYAEGLDMEERMKGTSFSRIPILTLPQWS